MSDVTVRISAKNDTRTGFQEALNDAKRFGNQASFAMAPNFSGKVGGGEVRKVFKGLAKDLAEASSPTEALQSVAIRVAGAFGKVTAAVGAFAVGEIIAAQFRKIGTAFESTTANLKQFNSEIGQVERATTFDESISGFDKLKSKADEVRATLQGLKQDIGATIANAAMGGEPFKLIEQQADTMDIRSAVALRAGLINQTGNSKEAAATMASGGQSAVDELLLKQKREKQIQSIRDRISATSNQEAKANLEMAIGNAQDSLNAEDQFRLESAKRGAADAAKQTANFGATPAQRLQQEKQAMDELVAKQKEYAEAATFAGTSLDPSGALNQSAAKYYEIQQQIEKSKQVQLSLTKAITDQQNAMAQRATDMRAANAEKAATAGMTDEQLLARERGKRNALDDSALQSGKYSNEDQIKREEITQRILDLEARIKQARESGLKGLEQRVADKQFAAMTPEQRQASLKQQMTDFEQQLNSGKLTGPEAFQRANQLLGMQESLGQGNGFQGSSGASAFQRIGFASNEYFDTRKKDNPTEAAKRAAKAAETLVDVMKSMTEPVILNPTSS